MRVKHKRSVASSAARRQIFRLMEKLETANARIKELEEARSRMITYIAELEAKLKE